MTDRPDLVLVVVDCLRADVLVDRVPPGAWEVRPVRTPLLDRFAAGGTVFTNVVASSTITTPSFATLLTGRFPAVHGVRLLQGNRVPAELPTLQGILADHGYHTVARVTGPLVRETGLDRGFADYAWRSKDLYLDTPWGERLLSEIASFPRPWLLLLHLWELHLPRRVLAHGGRPAGRLLYEQAVSSLDATLGRVLGALPAQTLVAITGDHGEKYGGPFDSTSPLAPLLASARRRIGRPVRRLLRSYAERIQPLLPKRLHLRFRTAQSTYGHGFDVSEPLIRVPWILAGPGVPAGKRSDARLRHVDVAPTLLALAGIEPPREWQRPVELAEPVEERIGYAETPGMRFLDPPNWNATVSSDGLKYVCRPFAPDWPERLYDLRADPRERADLARERPADLVRLRDAFQGFVEEQERSARGVAMSAEELATVERRLAELGYLEQ